MGGGSYRVSSCRVVTSHQLDGRGARRRCGSDAAWHVQWVADTLVGTPGAGADPELARADFQITVAEHLAAARFPPCAAGEGCAVAV